MNGWRRPREFEIGESNSVEERVKEMIELGTQVGKHLGRCLFAAG